MVLLLVAIVLGVVSLNYWKNMMALDHGVQINLAGRQRMLTQRIHRLLLQIHGTSSQNLLLPQHVVALDTAAKLFNDTLQGFTYGTPTRNSANQAVQFDPIDDPGIRGTLGNAQALWRGYMPLLQALTSLPTPDNVQAALAYADRHSEQLLELMEQLTTQMTFHSQAHAHQLLWLEGLSLTLLLLLLVWSLSLKRQLNLDAQARIEGLQQQVAHSATELQSVTRQIDDLIEVSPDMVWEKDTIGVYQSCNLPFENHFGLSPGQIIGKTDFDLVSYDLAQTYRESDRQAIAARQPTRLEEWHTPAGSNDACLYEIIRSPIRDVTGKLTGLQCVARDITERRAAETALAAADSHRRMLELCIAKLNDVVVITEADAVDEPGPRIVFVNDAFEQLTGYSRDEVIGQSPRLLQGAKTRRSELSRIRDALRAWKSVQTELINYKKNGDEYWTEINITPVADATGRFTRWIAVQRDITARKKVDAEMLLMCDRANESSRLKSEFLSAISHEMRTPMNAVLGMAQLLLKTPLTNRQTLYVNHIFEAATNYVQVINKALDFSSMEGGHLVIEWLPFDLRALMATLELFTAPKAQAKRLTLHCTIDHTLPQQLQGDERRLRQCLLILLDNAVKFTAKGGIVLNARAVSRLGQVWLRLEVTDTGIGLGDEVRERLFHPFVQGEGGMTRQYSGIGLGLVVCRQLVELMQGRMDVDSTPDRGSTFWLELPIRG